VIAVTLALLASFAWAGVPAWLLVAVRHTDFGRAAGAAGHPNVIVIMTDDLEMGTFNTMLAAGLLPHIKSRMVNQGYSFDNSFVTDSLCCPSRATFFTGQYPHNTGVQSNSGPNGGVWAFKDASSIATWLQAAGYWTGIVGKYLNGYGWDAAAARNSPLNPSYVPPGWNITRIFVDPSAYTAYDYKVSANGTVIDHRPSGEQPGNYHTDVMTAAGLDFMNDVLTNHAGRPFFLELAPMVPHFHLIDRDHQALYNECQPSGGSQAPFGSGNLFGSALRPAPRHANTIFGDAVHYPLPRPPSFNESNAGKPTWLQQRKALTATDIDCLQKQYWRRIEAMRAVDDMLGSLIGYTDRKGVTANTVFVFTSDNGYMMGEHRLTEKQVAYEESIRVPLVIRVPWNARAQHVSQLVVNSDIAPTVAALAGATPTLTVDGLSLLPILQGQHPLSRNSFLIEQFVGGVDTSPSAMNLGDYPVPESASVSVRVMNPPRLYTFYGSALTSDKKNGQELYDLATDQYEMHNLARDPASAPEVLQFQNVLRAYLACKGAACRALEQTFSVGTHHAGHSNLE
jgi:N-acetylglucosamine-6-sulfatase